MPPKLSAVAALAGSLLLIALMQGSAQASPLPGLSSHSNSLTLVADKGDEGGSNEGGGPSAGQGGKHHGGNVAKSDEGDHGGRGEDDHGDRGDHRHVAKQGDHDNSNHHHRHGHWRGGVWIWDTGPGYASDDCSWLRHRARETGSPYWWHRYHDCVGY